MTRAPLALRPSPRAAKRAAKTRVFVGLRALVAFAVTLLQLASALHFTLVPHSFSAALGGVVHVHGASQSRTEPRLGHNQRSQAFVSDALSCAVDVCPFADAPHGSLPFAPSAVSGTATFGAATLLTETEPQHGAAWRVFLTAPKTSPPV
jgi:hypothetical protein